MSTFREYLQKRLDTDPEFREWWELRCQLLQSDLENVEELLEAWIERERPYFVGPGWWPMLDDAMAKARAIAPDLVLHDVKEKYGRCDVTFWSEKLWGKAEALDAIADEVEKLSLTICENCGAPGHPREERWIKTHCDRCAALNGPERHKVEQETAERYFRGSHARHGAPKDRGEVREKKLKDYLDNRDK